MEMTWSSVAMGSYTLTAVATDNSGTTATSSPITVNVIGNPTLQIASPVPGATISDNTVVVSGTVQAPANSSININGTLGVIGADGSFFVNVPVLAGSQNLTATVWTQDGLSYSQTVTVNVVTPGYALGIDNEEGLNQLTTTLSLTSNGGPIFDHVNWYCDDSQTTAIITTTLAPPISCTYDTVGRYHPHVQIIDANGNMLYTSARYVEVDDAVWLDAILHNLYADMTSRIQQGNITFAMNEFTINGATNYSAAFAALKSQLPTILPQLGLLQAGVLSGDVAEYALEATRNGSPIAFTVYILRGTDGIWRIDSF